MPCVYRLPHLLQTYRYDLDRASWAPDWLSPRVLEELRSDGEARATLDAELKVGWMGLGGCTLAQLEERVYRCRMSVSLASPPFLRIDPA